MQNMIDFSGFSVPGRKLDSNEIGADLMGT